MLIGVVSKEIEATTVAEFFELFKTPWEFCRPQHRYDIVIATSDDLPTDLNATVLLVYNSQKTRADAESRITLESKREGQFLESNGLEFPIYGEASALTASGRPFLRRKGTNEIIGLDIITRARLTVRVGYDLFQEVSLLLRQGQPPANAHIPTLEMHIALLRSILTNSGVSFIEVPPVPAGYDYMACLTHDVDFIGIREHKFDHTMWGFIYRGLVGSLLDAMAGRTPWSKCRKNWKAVLSLPLVHLGWKDDFWLEFDRYVEIEKGLGSTFFFIPSPNYPGTRDSAPAPNRRAAKYDVEKIKEQVHTLVEHGCEIGLHGIDAWQDSAKAQAELDRIRKVSDQSKTGVRMHWLYFSENSPQALEQAGLSYDSTFGYNDAVGFRAGTSQVFRPIGAAELLELPLIIQDTALFYPGRMRLTEAEATQACKQVMKSMARFGGTLVVNWHTRSLSPERLWGDFYTKLLNEMRGARVWFGTAQDIVTWFRRRRAFQFHDVQFTEDGVRLKMSGPSMDGQPPLLVRVHSSSPRSSKRSQSRTSTYSCSNIFWKGEAELKVTASFSVTDLVTTESRNASSRLP